MRRLLGTLALLLAACGPPPAIEGVYADRSRVLSSSCGPVSDVVGARAAVSLEDDGALVMDLTDVHFAGDARGRRRLQVASDVTEADEVVSCGVFLPSAPVVDAAVSGVAGGASSTTAATPIIGARRQERLERLDTADNVLGIRQTLRFTDTDVCADGRVSTVPARDCEVTRLIDLRLVAACPAACQRVRPVRGTDDAVFCSCGGP